MTKVGFVRRWATNRAGNVGMMFAFCAPVLFVAIGGAIDLSGVYRAERGLQESLDMAGVAAARQSATADAATLQKIADTYFFYNVGEERRGDTRMVYGGVVKKDGYRVLSLSAERDYKTVFGPTLKLLSGGKLDWSPFPVGAQTEIVVENRSIEMALVLDNSGSMKYGAGTIVEAAVGNRKLDTLIEASGDLVEALMAVNQSSTGQPPTKIAVVPFSSAVNAGKEHLNAAWVDTYGESSIHHENLDWSVWTDSSGNKLAEKKDNRWVRISDGTVLTRQWVLENAKLMVPGPAVKKRVCSWWNCWDEWEAGEPVPSNTKLFPDGWAGCFESRPGGMAVSDTPPSTGDTLFVPMFAPDEYDGNTQRNNYLYDNGSNNVSGKSGYDAIRAQSNVNKYLTSVQVNITGDMGPNSGCRTKPLLPLTADQSKVDAAIDGMIADGATNIPEGLAWGLRALSPGAPFTEGKPYEETSNLKAIVLMTDGENTYFPSYTGSGLPVETNNENRSMWGTFGYGQTWTKSGSAQAGRLFDGTTVSKQTNTTGYKAAMDQLTTKACQTIKDSGRHPDGTDGIVIFTIAFDVKDGSAVKDILRGCASYGLVNPTEKLYYDAKDNSQLIAAFGKITEEVTTLRVAK